MASGVAPIEPTPLVSRTHTPRMQRIADQVGGRLVYIVITALIILPVWVATQSHMAGIQEAAPLDLPADQLAASAERSKPASTEPSTVVASMASLPKPPAAAPAFSLRFSGESWGQVVAPDGRSTQWQTPGKGQGG